MALTAKQEAFCLAFLASKVQARAYEASHDTRRMTAKTIRKRACELMKHAAVKARIADLQAAAAKEAVLDRATVLRELHRLARMAMGDLPIRKIVTQGRGKDAKPAEYELHHVDIMGAARAWELIGKLDEIRAFVDIHEHAGKDGAPLFPEAPATRDLARAVVDILRTAKIEQGPVGPADGEVSSTSSEAGLSPTSAGTGPFAAAPVPATNQPRVVPRRSSKSTLQPGETEVLDNGATIQLSAEFGLYFVHNGNGRLHGRREDLADARELARSLPTLERKK